jgi:trimethylamine--corrinoid protein Co-methyltransferase
MTGEDIPDRPSRKAGHARRRESSRAQRSSAPATPQIPKLEVPWAPLEIFSPDQIERIIVAAHRLLEEIGLEIRSLAARAVFSRNGSLVDDETFLVRIGREIVSEFCAHAPEQFILGARNQKRNLHVGGNVVNFGPVNGAPHVSDLERGRRYGDLASFRDALKIMESLGILHWQGGVVLEPVDLPVSTRHLDMYFAHITLSDAVWCARGIGADQVRDGLAMCAIEHGVSVDALHQCPRLMIITNVNSPRRVDAEILDAIMLMAEHGQCVVITPFTLMGAMAPVTLVGALVQQTAEALAMITLVQMIHPGTPSVMGGFTSNVDMRTGSPAFGTPEYVHATLGGAQIARRLKIPFRSSSVNAAPCVDAQATYESGFSLWASIMSHSHLINHAAGWLEGGLSASFEKIVVDAEMLRSWAAILQREEWTDDDMALQAIGAVPPGGHFFGSPHTLARYETAFYRPLLSDWNNFENWRDGGAKTATERAVGIWKAARDEFIPPALDESVRDALEAYIAKRKVSLTDAPP